MTGPFGASKESGMSLPAILVGLAIAGILASIVSDIGVNSMQFSRQIAASNQRGDVEKFIKARRSCAKTLAALSRNRSTIIIYDKNSHPILPHSDGVMTLGKWKIRVTHYNPGSGDFTILASHPDDASGDFKPLFTQQPLNCK